MTHTRDRVQHMRSQGSPQSKVPAPLRPKELPHGPSRNRLRAGEGKRWPSPKGKFLVFLASTIPVAGEEVWQYFLFWELQALT